MIAAIYARKSTEQTGVADDEKSVTRQVEHAKAYATGKGWRVAEEHIYVDDGISGAEFVKRPGLARLMNVLKPKPPFQVLIMSEESRLGREQIETAYLLKQIITAGVKVFYYLEDRERKLEGPVDKVLLSVTAFADELEREKARERTHDAMVRKAKALHVTGGRVFGYKNKEVFAESPGPDGRRQRLYVERVIDAGEAAVVRRIFELCAAGMGMKRIAVTLNKERALAPVPRPATRPHGWSPSSVREILYRPLYRGDVVWNRSKKRDPWGVKKQRPRPEQEWIRIPAAELRIVSDELWNSAHDRLQATRATYLRTTRGSLWGRPPSGIESKYLLTGMAQCGCCGGSLHVRSRDHGKRRPSFYVCTSYRLRGRTVCKNNLEAPMGVMNQAVLDTLEQDLLRPEVIERAIAKAVERLRPDQSQLDVQRGKMKADLAQVEEELARLTTAIASGGDLPSLLQGIKDRERRRAHLREQLAALESCEQVSQFDFRQIEQELRARLEDWRGLLCRQVAQARQILRKLLVGKLVFTPREDASGRYYEFAGQGTLRQVLAGVAAAKGRVSPAGFEPALSA